MSGKTEKALKTKRQRGYIAADKASQVLTKRMGSDLDILKPEDFKTSEYHNLRWGWFYYLVNSKTPDILVKVAYRYKTKDFHVTTYSRTYVDYTE